MIRKLQNRLILFVVGALLVIAAGIVIAINWFNVRSIHQQMYASLDILAENQGQRPFPSLFLPGEFGTDRTGDARGFERDGRMRGDRGSEQLASLSNSYTISFDTSGNVQTWSSDRAELYSDDSVNEVAGQIWRLGEGKGHIGTQFYCLQKEEDGTAFAIVIDGRSELANVNRLLVSTIVITALACLVLGILAVLLIRRMLQPVGEAFEKQKQFVWDASHELKTPLAVISANAEVLAAQVGENEYLEYIRSEVRRTDGLVQNLLTLARMDSGTVAAHIVDADLSRALLSVVLPFESTVFEAGKTMETDIPDGIRCRADEAMFKQLAVILLSNALKYSDEGGSIRVGLKETGNKCELSVWNSGEPIGEEDQARIFDRFYRVDSSHNRETPGNGLGLSIAATIAEAHKGKISVTSKAGNGTLFTVSLPK